MCRVAGIFLSDIAEVRRGASSFGFKTSKASWIKPVSCVSIIGSERTIDVQIVNEKENDVSRLLFIDMLNLLTIQCLQPTELKLRNKIYRRVNTNMHLKVYKKRQSPRDEASALKMTELLSAGIEVDVEMYSPYYGSVIKQKLLKYSATERKLYITNKIDPNAAPNGDSLSVDAMSVSDDEYSSGGEEEQEEGQQSENGSTPSNGNSPISPLISQLAQQNGTKSGSVYFAHGHSASPVKDTAVLLAGQDLTTQNRSISIDDISEVRPGKISFCADGCEDSLVLSIIASETIICLPVSSVKFRNNMIARFQAFIQVITPRSFVSIFVSPRITTDAPRLRGVRQRHPARVPPQEHRCPSQEYPQREHQT